MELQLHAKAVAERLARVEFFTKGNLLIANTVLQKVQSDRGGASYQDLNAAANALTKAQENVLGKTSGTVINNTSSQQVANVTAVRTPAQIRAIREMLDAAL